MSSLTPMGVQMVADLTKWSPGVSRALSDTDKLDTSFDKVAKSSEQVGRGLDDAGDAAKKSSSAFGDLKTMVSGAVAAFALGGFAQAVGDLNSLGIEVTRTSNVFRNLAGGTEAAARLMDDMRSSTRGAVDDMNLMSGANRLVAMGLATNAEEAAHLTRVAISLGAAFGRDASESVENFSLLLANQSVLRLDSFGISAAKVKARIQELTAAGMESQAAFNTATLEQADLSMIKLGDAVDASATAWQRLSVDIENAKQDLAEFVAGGIEAGAGIIKLSGIIADFYANQGDMAAEAETAVRATADATAALFSQAARRAGIDNPIFGDQLGGNYTPSQFFNELQRGAAEFESVMGRTVTTVDELKQGLDLAGSAMMQAGLSEGMTDAMQFYLDDRVNAEQRAVEALQEQNREAARYLVLAQRTAAIEQARLQHASEMAALGAEEQARMEMSLMGGTHGAEIANQIIRQQQAQRAVLFSNLSALTNSAQQAAFSSLYGGGDGLEVPEYITQQQADWIAQTAQYAESIRADFQAANERGLITDAQLGQFETAAATVKTMASDAQKAADAFANMRLPEALGQGLQPGQGVLSDVGGDVLSMLEGQGVDDAALEALKTQFQLATGEETELSQAYQNEVLPRIAEIYNQFGAEAALTAAENYAEGLRQARLAGLSDEFLAENAALMTGFAVKDNGQLTTNMFTGETGTSTVTQRPGGVQGRAEAQPLERLTSPADAILQSLIDAEAKTQLAVDTINQTLSTLGQTSGGVITGFVDTIGQPFGFGTQTIFDTVSTGVTELQALVESRIPVINATIDTIALNILTDARVEFQNLLDTLNGVNETVDPLQAEVDWQNRMLAPDNTAGFGGGTQTGAAGGDPLQSFMTELSAAENATVEKVGSINATLSTLGGGGGGTVQPGQNGQPTIFAGVDAGGAAGIPAIDSVTTGLDALYAQALTQIPEVNTQLINTETDMGNVNVASETLGTEGVTSIQPFFAFVISQAQATVEIIRTLGSELDGLAGAAESIVANTGGGGGGTGTGTGARPYAEGGWASGLSMVGERGRELIATGSDAYILSNPRTESFLSNLARISGAGGTTNNRTNTTNVYMNNYSEAAYAASQQMQADNLRGF